MGAGVDFEIDLTGDALDILKDLQKQFGVLNDKVEDVEDTVKKAGKGFENSFGGIATGFNQTLELADKLKDSLEFANEIGKLKTSIQQFTDLSGDSLEDATTKAFRLQEVYGDDALEISAAANALTNQLGGTFDENLALIEKGYQKGSNLNGDMLQQLKEYAAQLKATGISGAEGLAIMANASKGGVYDDKALDSMKEAGLSLKEMGQTQIDAIAGIGLTVDDLAGKSTLQQVQAISQATLDMEAQIEAINQAVIASASSSKGFNKKDLDPKQLEVLKNAGIDASSMLGKSFEEVAPKVGKALDAAKTQARQLVMADIFKGAGEDAGQGFIDGLATMDLNIENIPSVQVAGEGIKSFFAEIKGWIGNTFGTMMPYVNVLAQMGTAISGLIPLMRLMNVEALKNIMLGLRDNAVKVTGIALKGAQALWTGIVTVAQWAFNVAATANPIGVIIMAIAALIAIIIGVISQFDGFGDQMKNLKKVFGVVWEAIKLSFKLQWLTIKNSFMIGIDLMKLAWLKFKAATGFGGAENDAAIANIKATMKGRADEITNTAKELMNKTKEIGETFELKIKLKKDEEEEEDPMAQFGGGQDGAVAGQYGNADMVNGTGSVLGGGNSKDNKKQGSKGSSGSKIEKKEITANIQNLVKNLNINVGSSKEAPAKLRAMVGEALVGAVRDFEVAVS